MTRRTRIEQAAWWCPALKTERGSVTRSGLISQATCCGSPGRAPELGHRRLLGLVDRKSVWAFAVLVELKDMHRDGKFSRDFFC